MDRASATNISTDGVLNMSNERDPTGLALVYMTPESGCAQEYEDSSQDRYNRTHRRTGHGCVRLCGVGRGASGVNEPWRSVRAGLG